MTEEEVRLEYEATYGTDLVLEGEKTDDEDDPTLTPLIMPG